MPCQIKGPDSEIELLRSSSALAFPLSGNSLWHEQIAPYTAFLEMISLSLQVANINQCSVFLFAVTTTASVTVLPSARSTTSPACQPRVRPLLPPCTFQPNDMCTIFMDMLRPLPISIQFMCRAPSSYDGPKSVGGSRGSLVISACARRCHVPPEAAAGG